jgi:hypothetical protein
VWAHPELLPTASDLYYPLGFLEVMTVEEITEEAFDQAIAELLDSETGDRPDPDDPDDHE